MFFDENFNYIPYDGTTGLGSYSRQIESDADAMNVLDPTAIAPKNGYAFVYVSNESDVQAVYFDNLAVVHTRSKLLEEATYYPFGLKIAALSAQAFQKPTAPDKFQGEYSDHEEEMGWNDFELRSYDPQIGRWLQVDPYDEFASPYVGMGNDPVNNVDPDGGGIGDIPVVNAVVHTLPDVVVKAKNLSGIPTSLLNFVKDALPAIGNAYVYSTLNGSAQFLNTGYLGDETIVNGQRYYTQAGIQDMLSQGGPNAINTTTIESLRVRFWMERAAAYASLDHAGGQVDFPSNSIYPSVYPDRQAYRGKFSLFKYNIDNNGYLTSTLATPKPILFEVPAYLDGPRNPLSALKTMNNVSHLLSDGANLAEHLGQLEKYGKDGVKLLENGRYRYYGTITPASKPGEMIGRRVVREWNPANNVKRTWMETLDASGRTRVIRPQNGLSKTHYMFDKFGKFTGKW